MKASHKLLQALKEAGTQTDWLDEMQTRQELYQAISYADYEALDAIGRAFLP